MTKKQTIDTLSKFLKKLARTTGAVSAEGGVVTFEDGLSFDLRVALKPTYVVVQEGGSSSELYFHAWPTRTEANTDRKYCATAAYKTSPVIRVPATAAALGEDFFEPAENIMQGVAEVDFP